MNDIDKATEALWHDTKLECFKVRSDAERVAESLSAAGLLRTDADKLNERAANACAALAKAKPYWNAPSGDSEFDSVIGIGRAILDARKPSPRWVVDGSVLRDGFTRNIYQLPSGTAAEAAAAALNAEGAK